MNLKTFLCTYVPNQLGFANTLDVCYGLLEVHPNGRRYINCTHTNRYQIGDTMMNLITVIADVTELQNLNSKSVIEDTLKKLELPDVKTLLEMVPNDTFTTEDVNIPVSDEEFLKLFPITKLRSQFLKTLMFSEYCSQLLKSLNEEEKLRNQSTVEKAPTKKVSDKYEKLIINPSDVLKSQYEQYSINSKGNSKSKSPEPKSQSEYAVIGDSKFFFDEPTESIE